MLNNDFFRVNQFVESKPSDATLLTISSGTFFESYEDPGSPRVCEP